MTNSIIEKIFADGINPLDDELQSEEYKAAFETYSEVYKKLLETLSKDEIALLIKIDESVNKIDLAACTEKFIQGFKTGFKFALDVLK